MMEPVVINSLPKEILPKKDWAVHGKGNGKRKVIKAAPLTDDELIELNKKLKEKYSTIKKKEQRSELIESAGASLAIVAFGSSARISLDAITKAASEGIPVTLFRPISLWPFPNDAINKLTDRGITKLLVVEANNGQMVEDVQSTICNDVQIEHFGFGGGYILNPDEIFQKIKQMT
jgi:2-oxoglutarate ferredoxin oxidoreductase subunit alpha